MVVENFDPILISNNSVYICKGWTSLTKNLLGIMISHASNLNKM